MPLVNSIPLCNRDEALAEDNSVSSITSTKKKVRQVHRVIAASRVIHLAQIITNDKNQELAMYLT